MNRLRQDWSVVWANSSWMPRTVFRSATNRPVRYSAKWRRWHSLAKRSLYWAKAAWTSSGNSTIPGMIRCPEVQLRLSKPGAKRADFAYFNAAAERITKRQLLPSEGAGRGGQQRTLVDGFFDLAHPAHQRGGVAAEIGLEVECVTEVELDTVLERE